MHTGLCMLHVQSSTNTHVHRLHNSLSLSGTIIDHTTLQWLRQLEVNDTCTGRNCWNGATQNSLLNLSTCTLAHCQMRLLPVICHNQHYNRQGEGKGLTGRSHYFRSHTKAAGVFVCQISQSGFCPLPTMKSSKGRQLGFIAGNGYHPLVTLTVANCSCTANCNLLICVSARV